MKRLLIASLIVVSGCCSSRTPVTSETMPPAATPGKAASLPCHPADTTINGVLWMQTSAEYRAITREIYATAHRTLDAALADPSWTAATEQTKVDASMPPAIILDLDETVIDTSAFQQGLIAPGLPYSDAAWHDYAMNDTSLPIAAGLEFVRYAKERGVEVFYITNRHQVEEPPLRKTLLRLGFPFDPKVETLLTRDQRPEWTSSDKTARRAFVAEHYRVLMLFGDDLNDFVPANGKSLEERDRLIERYSENLGRKWFVMPNPVYGSWELSMLGDTKGLDDCQKVEKKIRTIRGK